VKNNLAWAAIVASIFTPTFAAPKLEYVVIFSRHGVRSPTWDAKRLAEYSAEPWPEWGVSPGYLTPHGRELITKLGSYYREWLQHDGLLKDGCADKGRVYVWADAEQRTIETGRAFAESILPGCGVAANFGADSSKDPIFSGLAEADPKASIEQLRRRLGIDPQKRVADHREALDALQYILDGGRTKPKKLVISPAEVAVALQDKSIDLQGPFAVGSTLSEDFLLEYTNGMRDADSCLGRLTKERLYKVLEIHRAYADLMRRTPELARARGSNLLSHILASVAQAVSHKNVDQAIGPPGTALLILSGHDTNQSNISGMMGLSWALSGYQPDETPPGGAIIFTLWHKPEDGQRYVRLEYLAPSLDQMRNGDTLTLKHPPLILKLAIPGCNESPDRLDCTWVDFRRVLERSMESSLNQP